MSPDLVIARESVATDGGYGWVVVFGAFMIHVVSDGFVYSFGVIAKSFVQEFDSDNATVATVNSLLMGLMLIIGPVASAICDRIGCRITAILGAIIAFFGCLASWQATSMISIIFSVGIVMGIGFGLMYCPAIIIVTVYFERYRSLATGITVCGAAVGTIIFSKIMSLFLIHFAWRKIFLIYSGIMLLCVPCGALFRPLQSIPVYGAETDTEASKCEPLSTSININTTKDDLNITKKVSLLTRIYKYIKQMMDLSLLTNSIFVLYAISNFLTSIAFNSPSLFMAFHAEQAFGLNKEDAAFSITAFGFGNLIGRIAFGLLCDWKPPFRWAQNCARNRLWIYAISLILCGAATSFVFAIRIAMFYTAFCFFFGFTISPFVCLTSVVLVDLVGVDKISSIFGQLLFVQGIATFIGLPIAGVLYDQTKNYDWTFALCGISLFAGGVFLLFILPLTNKAERSDINDNHVRKAKKTTVEN